MREHRAPQRRNAMFAALLALPRCHGMEKAGAGVQPPPVAAPAQHPAPAASTDPPRVLCTAIGCSSGIAINFSPPLSILGTYTFVLRDPEGTHRCELTLVGRRAWQFPGTPCPITIVPGTAMKPNRTKIFVEETPEWLEIELRRGGSLLAHARLTPKKYESFQPNGPDCGPPCLTASVEVPLMRR